MNDIYSFLQNILGSSYQKLRGGETLWSCPFCHHHKKKLAIKLPEGQWHCWVCEEKGSNLHTLLKKLNAPKHQHKELAEILGEPIKIEEEDDDEVDERIFLPKEFEPLWTLPFSHAIQDKDYERANAFRYLNNRGVTAIDIAKYQLGFCRDGKYANRIVVPSYDENGQLNFFSSRAYYDANPLPYLNPSGLKNKIIFNELLISWSLPIVICEGPFDAIAIRRNAIPLLGKTISDKLRGKIYTENVKHIYLALDSDAIKNSIKLAKTFLEEGINVYVLDLEEKDPAELGFEKMQDKIREAKPLTFGDLITLKLSNL